MASDASGASRGSGLGLTASNVSVSFGGVTAVNDVSLSVEPGECHGVVGPNGAGKTTLLNALSGVVRTTGGQIILGGERIDHLRPQRRRALGLVRTFQNPALVGDLTALENVKVGLHQVTRWPATLDLIGLGLTRRGERTITAAARAALDAVSFPRSRFNVPAVELSHGDQKIIDLARALSGQPRAILLDEPTAGLTVGEMDKFAEVLRQQQGRQGPTKVIVSHHMRFLTGLASTMTVMESGAVLAQGALDEVSRRPEVVSAFLGEYDAAI